MVDAAEAVNTEFGVMHPAFTGRPADWGFTGVMDGGDARFGGLAKWRLRRGGGGLHARVRFGDGRLGGAPVVVPKARPQGAAAQGRGDGSDAVYLLTLVHDARTGESLLSVVDGESMAQAALLRVPERVPFGLHGHWVPEAEI